ncbi:MAG TPA: tRNA glutamyl-Q(34) synthetase GluQRS [Marinagarivorans sp.]
MTPTPYIGRFAPSPSGPLHLGSLTCALASYFDAKANYGQWLLRMEDIDPPREPAGAAQAIIECLRTHKLHWDGDVLYQSQRSHAYRQALHQLHQKQLTYYCQCTRKRLRALGGQYDGHCRDAGLEHGALRLNIQRAQDSGQPTQVAFEDRLQGLHRQDLTVSGDFVIHRKDGLFAYQLAVIVDDIFQGVNQIVRGDDLLDVTFNQLLLFKLFEYPAPRFCHLPVVLDTRGYKMSKQHGSPGVNLDTPLKNVQTALQQMGFEPPPQLPLEALLIWGTERWQMANPLQ